MDWKKGDEYHTLPEPSTVPVHRRNEGDGITVNKGRRRTWATTMPPPGVKPTLLLSTESAMTHLLLLHLSNSHVNYMVKTFARNTAKIQIFRASLVRYIHKCQCNLITTGVCTPAQN